MLMAQFPVLLLIGYRCGKSPSCVFFGTGMGRVLHFGQGQLVISCLINSVDVCQLRLQSPNGFSITFGIRYAPPIPIVTTVNGL